MIVYEPKVLHQGIDFLTIDYFCIDYNLYLSKFVPFLKRLEVLKEKAQNQDIFGVKFVKSEVLEGFGNWFVSSKGLNRFAFYMENEDFRVFISRAKLNTELPQIRVEVPAKTIFRVGVRVAIELFEKFIKKLFGKNYIRKVNRIDLATDVGGILYTPQDYFRFQTRMGNVLYKDEININNYMRFQRFQGIQFGKGAKVFRIYDKTQKISKSPNEAYIKEKWFFNGYDERYPVYRHEIQLRREELKKYIPISVSDEVEYFLSNLGNIWFRAINLVEFVPLTNDEIQRIFDNPLIKSATKRQIFYRAKKDTRRFQFWDILRSWDEKEYVPIEVFKRVKSYSIENVKRLFKAFVGALFKYSGGDLTKFKEVIDEVEKDLQKQNLTLIDYGLLKLATSFIENVEAMMLSGEVIPESEYIKVINFYDVFEEKIKEVNNKDYQRILKKVINYV